MTRHWTLWMAAALAVLAVLAVLYSYRGMAGRHPADLPRAAAPAPRGDSPTAHRPVTITFWNVEWFPGHRPDAGERAQASHVAAVVPVVERLDPDVLGLEEVADAASARLITDHLKGFRVDVCTEFPPGTPTLTRHQQTVLCSRLPLVENGWENWQPSAGGLRPRRGFAFAAYQPTPGEVLLVYGVHLKSNFLDEPGGDATNAAMREESMRQLAVHERAEAARCARMGRVRLVVVGGDMNTSLDDARFESEQTLRALMGQGFGWGWEGVPLERRFTLPNKGRYPAACFDHIFYRGKDVRLTECAVEATGRAASDHRPVTARFEW